MPTDEERFGPMLAEIRKSYDMIKRNQRIAIVPQDFPEELEAQLKRQPFIVEVRRDAYCPAGKIIVIPAHPEMLMHPPV